MTTASATRTIANFVDGHSQGGSGEMLPLVNPATGEVFAQAPISTTEEVDYAPRRVSSIPSTVTGGSGSLASETREYGQR